MPITSNQQREINQVRGHDHRRIQAETDRTEAIGITNAQVAVAEYCPDCDAKVGTASTKTVVSKSEVSRSVQTCERLEPGWI
jgi:hypothetical protein